MKQKLLAKSTTGKEKFIELEVDGAYLITRWGYVDGKQQETRELCEGKNIGKANETTPEIQAVLEYARKIKKKLEHGYSYEDDFNPKANGNKPNFHRLQKEFCPCKPIAKPPKDALTGGYLADRKYNGVNIIITKDDQQEGHIYTRRIDDITEQLIQFDCISEVIGWMKDNSMILVELTYFENYIEVPEMLRGLINKRRSAEQTKEHYDTLTGELVPVIFDVMFWDDKFVGSETFEDRRKILMQNMHKNVPITQEFNLIEIDHGKSEGWEGFVLRKSDGTITYTMNGKAKRHGSWKWKYEETDDFIVLDAEYGKGKHSKYFARFKLGQYDKNGKIIDCGYCGPGKFKVDELKAFHKARNGVGGVYMIKPYIVFEVLYRTRTKDNKLEFPVLQRIRDDKPAKECIYNG